MPIMKDGEHQALSVIIANISHTFRDLHVPPPVARVACRLWLWMYETWGNTGNLPSQDEVAVKAEELWLEEPQLVEIAKV